MSSFSEGDAAKILSIARYLIATNGNTLPRLESWQVMHSLPYREPVAFAKQPGNVPDVISIENAMKQIKCLDLEKPLIVTDNGCHSQENMMKFAPRNMKFLTLVDSNVVWVREVADD